MIRSPKSPRRFPLAPSRLILLFSPCLLAPSLALAQGPRSGTATPPRADATADIPVRIFPPRATTAPGAPNRDPSVRRTAQAPAPAQIPAAVPPLEMPEPTPPGTPDPDAPLPVRRDEAPTQPPQPEYPLDLAVALRLAEGENPEIARVRTEILAALAEQQQARVLLLPSFNAGLNYHGHVGNLQRSSGRILNLSEQSLYVGGGARTLAAESVGVPAVNIASPITEAWFEPLAARRRVDRARFDTRAMFNRVLGDVAVLYIELVGAQARVEAIRLNADQTAEVLRVTESFARSGEGRMANAERSEVEYQLRIAELREAEGEVSATSARLAERLNLDPSVRLVAHSGPLAPILLVDPASDPLALSQFALEHRPELGARTAEIAESQVRVREEIYRPLLPTLWIGFSGGALGGGSNLSEPTLGRFTGRTDFDVRLYWTVLNFGVGNAARIKGRKARLGEAVADRSATIAAVRREVVEALAISGARSRQITEAQRQLQIAERGFAEDLQRTRQALGRPIEVLDNLELLSQARLKLIAATVEFDQAQFRLFVALGSPPPIGPTTLPEIAPPPITTPLQGPIDPGFGPNDGLRVLKDMRGKP